MSIQKAGVSLAKEELKQESKDASPGSSLMSVLREWRMWWLSAIWAIVVLNIDLMVFWIPLMLRHVPELTWGSMTASFTIVFASRWLNLCGRKMRIREMHTVLFSMAKETQTICFG